MKQLHSKIIIGFLLILLGVAVPPILKIYTPFQMLVWLGLLLLINEYDKKYRQDRIVRFGKYGLIIYISIWVMGLVLFLLFPDGHSILPGKPFYILTHPGTLIIDTLFPIPLKQLANGGFLLDQTYLRKCISMVTDVSVYIGTGCLIAVIHIIIKNFELTSRSSRTR